MIFEKSYKVGDLVRVKAIFPPVYQLPDGLPIGATVKVLRRDVGYTDVEYEGRTFTASIVLIDNGLVRVPD